MRGKHPQLGIAPQFIPPLMLRNAQLQTILGSLRLRNFQTSSMSAAAEPVILHGTSGIRLSGALSTKGSGSPKGLIILLHGWEGCIDSTYILNAADYFFNHGLDVFRLNLRDHGDSHALNQGIFYATLLDETYEAIMQAARLAGPAPVFLCGFSLGGNFALRVALKHSQSPDPAIDLRHVFAISPVLDPSRTTDAIDRQHLLRRYFIRKWQRSLRIKQHCFPDIYDFSDVFGLTGIRQMTEFLLKNHATYRCAEDYFADYNLCAQALKNIRLTTTVITAADDPIIPVEDFTKLQLNPQVRLIIHEYGGHNGFLTGLHTNRWYEPFILECVNLK